jgi:uncharacterized protein (TIRG00374 family)
VTIDPQSSRPRRQETAALRRMLFRRIVGLTLTGVGLYFVWPSLLTVFSAWPDLLTLNPAWLLGIAVLEVLSFVSMWILLGLLLRTKDRFVVSTSQLASNAAARIMPGGPAVGGALQFQMLRAGGIGPEATATGLTMASVVTTAMLTALPLLAIPPILAGVPVHDDLVDAVFIAAALFAALFVAGAVMLFLDGPIRFAGRLIAWAARRLRRSPHAPTNYPEELRSKRDEIRAFLGKTWGRALLATTGKVGFDYLALLASVAAVGVVARPSLILLAFVASGVLGMIPITPGGLGFVEVGLTATLGFAGVPAAEAVLAALVYRLFSFWLPLPAGAVAFALFRRRYPQV